LPEIDVVACTLDVVYPVRSCFIVHVSCLVKQDSQGDQTMADGTYLSKKLK